ncbi:MFS transporter [Boseongicola aestuarii]|uniref:Putative MFS-type transporter YcaD n=1 Tax=Boseongicola aestuarii TaxID=1470561 RepID=A0A238IX59_9RHOB|nr:MFS transporter [Boseongicola aestuarii]SMX22340.1 putative MFS-type transporter YcaD [Boseongicola aestuarii]
MLKVLGSTWALLLGILLLMVGNGLQGSLIGIRGAIENFSTTELSVITSAYFAGFLIGSRMAPEMIRRVGHVRVFAALGSFISAVLILYPTITDPWAWIVLRVIFGFSFSGVYVTAESWLNNASTNETRGQSLSLYVMAQMVGIVSSQALLNVADPAGFILFVIPSVLVSLSFAPILLSAAESPKFDTTKPMTLKQIYTISPLGCVGMFLMGAVFAAQFGMASIYGTRAGFSVAEISIFVSAIFIGGMLFQYPFGWVSDRMDRRLVILAAAVVGGIAGLLGLAFGGSFEVAVFAAFIMGGMSNPLYALLIAYTNDYLQVEDMAAASGGLLFINGLGAVLGPVITGWMLTAMGPEGFWAYLAFFMFILAAFVGWRMTQRPSVYSEEAEDYDAVSYAPMMPTGTIVAVEAAQGYYAENVESIDEGKANEPAPLDSK